MADPSVALRAAVKAALKAVGLTCYDAIPSNRAYPYVALGPTQHLPDEGETFLQLDVWSNLVTVDETGAYALTIRNTLHREPCEACDLAVEDHTVHAQEVRSEQHQVDHEARNSRAIIALRFVTDAAVIESEA